ncbi:putative quinate permease [Talaromyces proteolyticus]|uniref:Quinate permease n=1 Tax=Talaromyces proteolyticus TaxID=1131652 RepID=A0AAD4PS36_9EURO|nr:putative quinate permease [Talaromyces proteolyticus]KAH8690325.1 putative quinate permease [Talaromyces proteolyticus]
MGGRSPMNILKLRWGDEPREVLNWRLWLAVFSFGIMGAARGVDEGLISGTIDSADFRNLLNLPDTSTSAYANIKATIAAMVSLGSVAGAAMAFLLCDRIGRLWATRQLCVLWVVGIIIFMCNDGNLGMVYAGRFIAGLGIGQASVVAPIYLSEISPKSIRGLCTMTFAGAVYIGIMLAYFASWGASLHIPDNTSGRWLVPTSLHLIFAAIIAVLSFFNYESPRYLIKRGKDRQATANLARIRNLPPTHETIVRELCEIQLQLEEEKAAVSGHGWISILREMFCNSSSLYRIYLGFTIQLLTQWCGAQSITVYAPDFFLLAGVSGQNEKLFATCILGVVKFVGALLCAFYLVDVIGRKRSLGIGIAIQTISMVYIAIFLSIVGTPNPDSFTKSQKSASIGAIFMIYLCSFGWAMGWNGIQYLINAEIYPLRIRAASSSLIMMLHFANQYGANRAVPDMLLSVSKGGMGPAGSFWFFVGLTSFSALWAWFSIPETSGLTLEGVDRLFTLPWYKIGRYGATEARALQHAHDERINEMATKRDAVEVEAV